ncbi:MAG TPA: Ig-like domain-containing protein [Casimicrobiaceae bacterium]|nr:Ig-like domain-containing protein [Casimicrobiaceae bacterium]
MVGFVAMLQRRSRLQRHALALATGVLLVSGVTAQPLPAAVISASRLFGTHWEDTVNHLARAADGKLYLHGRLGAPASELASTAFTNAGQQDVYVARLDPATIAIEWMRPIGRGASNLLSLDQQDRVDAFALGADGMLYVAAYATSARYPQQSGAYTGWGGAKTIYRVDRDGNVTTYAGPLDPAIKSIRALAADVQGNVYFTGRAARTLVTTPGAIVAGAQIASSDSAPYLVKIDAITRAPSITTFLAVPSTRAATPNEQSCRQPFADDATTPYAIAIAPDATIYVAGQANPADMPATPGAADTLDSAFRDAFVMRINATGTALLFTARFGGRDNDRATDLLVEPDGNVLVVGKWLDKGNLWYGTRGGFQTSIAHQWSWSNPCESSVPTEAGFLLRVSPTGGQVGAASMIGAVGGDLAGWMNYPGTMPLKLATDGVGNVFITGTTDSGQSLPTLLPFIPDAELYQLNPRPTHAFVLKVRASDFALLYGSRLGARDTDAGAMGIAIDGAGSVFIAGAAASAAAFPMINAPWFGRTRRYSSSFIARVNEVPSDFRLVITPSQPLAGTVVEVKAVLADPYVSGTVEFRNGTTLIGSAPLANGSAQISLPLAAGMHQLSGTVRGAGVWTSNTTAPATVVVQQTSAAP